jgi:two-component system OmpR family sensor kinase
MDRGTLSRQLILRTASLVALVALIMDIVGIFAVRQILLNDIDTKLWAARPLFTGRGTGEIPFSELLNGIDLVVQSDGTRFGGLASHGGRIDPTSEGMEQLRDMPYDEITTMSIDGWGEYRVIRRAMEAPGGPRGFRIDDHWYGLPVGDMNQAIWELIGILAAASVIAILLAAFIAGRAVHDSLKDLNRMADTASQIATMTLDRGDVALTTRLPDSSTDPTTEVGRVGLAFNRMLDNVSDALDSRQQAETRVRQFVADASHELRNPIAAIRGYAELTERKADELPSEAAFAVSRIDAESKRMSLLVEDMLLLARLDNGPNTNPQQVDVVESVLNAVSDTRVAAPEHNWLLDLPSDPIIVYADRNQLQQVWVNLLSNASKHTPPGTTVTTTVKLSDNHVVVTVLDNGPGISPELQSRVFERFVRADAARTHHVSGSTGLGLAIVQAVVRAHGGTITLESRLATQVKPGFTQFTVTLPVAS